MATRRVGVGSSRWSRPCSALRCGEPARLGLLREVMRLGGEWTARVPRLAPVIESGPGLFLDPRDAARQHARQTDPNLVLVSAYSTVMGVATEVEVLRAVESTLRDVAASELLRRGGPQVIGSGCAPRLSPSNEVPETGVGRRDAAGVATYWTMWNAEDLSLLRPLIDECVTDDVEWVDPRCLRRTP